MLSAGLVGALVSFPLWVTGRISDRAMIGLTMVLSWAALWYEGYNAVVLARREKGEKED